MVRNWDGGRGAVVLKLCVVGTQHRRYDPAALGNAERTGSCFARMCTGGKLQGEGGTDTEPAGMMVPFWPGRPKRSRNNGTMKHQNDKRTTDGAGHPSLSGRRSETPLYPTWVLIYPDLFGY